MMTNRPELPSDVFALIAQTSCEGIVIIRRDSVIVFVNRAAGKLFGYLPEELIGQSLTMLMPEELREAHLAGVAAFLRTRKPRVSWEAIEFPGLHRTGRRIPLEISFAEASSGAEVLFAGFLRDLSTWHWDRARLAAQYAVADILSAANDEESAFQEILRSVGSHLGFVAGNVWIAGEDVLRLQSSWHASAIDAQAFENASRNRTFRPGEGLPGRAWAGDEPTWIAALETEHDFPRLAAASSSHLQSGIAFPIRSGAQTIGVMEFFSTHVRPLEPSLVEILDAISKQVSQFSVRYRVQHRLRGAELEHRTMFDNSNDAFGVSTGEHFVYVNQAFARMFGWNDPDDLIGVSIYETLPPSQQAEVREHRRRRHAGLPEPMRFESRGMRKDGTEFPTEVRATDYWIDGQMYTLAIMRDTTREQEARDILTQSNAALRRANDDLEQFAYAASHDLQEPLRLINLYSQLLRRRHDGALPDDARMLLATITDSAQRMNDLVNDLLSYTNAASLEAAEAPFTDVKAVLADTMRTLQDRIAGAQAVIASGDLPVVRAHRTHVFQLLQNLLSNSIKYRAPDREAVIRVTSSAPEDGFVRISVRDNGIGIAPEYHERIFGVFKRLHTTAIPGTGIGLAICKKIAEHYGGSIDVESTLGIGSTFTVTLPAEQPGSDGAD